MGKILPLENKKDNVFKLFERKNLKGKMNKSHIYQISEDF
jgi:hypothetical protein